MLCFRMTLDGTMDDITACAAVMGIDEDERLIVCACDDIFVHLMGKARAGERTYPMLLDDFLAESALHLAFREDLFAYFSSGGARPPEKHCDFKHANLWWRFFLNPVNGGRNACQPRQVLVTGSDMVAKARAGGVQQANASRYRALVDMAYDAIVTMDSHHHITFFNRAAESLFGYTSEEILGQPIVTLLPEQYRAGHPQKVQRFSETYQPVVRQITPPRMDGSNSVYGRHRDGTVIPVEIAISKIILNGETEFMAIVRDIRDRARLMDYLKKQAATDALTGLPNRREFVEFADGQLAAVGSLSVFILDVDFFKKINDRYGHDMGDEVLRVLAQVASSMMREDFLFARWGGEEFVAAFPGMDKQFAFAFADRLRQRYECQAFEHAWRVKPVPFTVSIGVAACKAGEMAVDALMRNADRALYRAKERGRNRVELE